MDLVNLMYRYINKIINSDKLLSELKSIDLSKYSKKEVDIIKELVLDIENIKESIPNEIDEIEIKRKEEINKILVFLKEAKASEKTDEEAKKFINKNYNILVKEKEIVRDGGRLYTEIFKLMTNNKLVNEYTDKMNNKELLDFITKYISVPMPPVINQEAFNELVEAGIKEDKRESLWRLATNYSNKNIDFSHIEDYFIEKKDEYYVIELISAVKEDLDMDKLIDKIVNTKNKEFIRNIRKTGIDMNLFTSEELNKLNIL